ncbi:unnamed protein product [Ilex paraguariensis]|uniref:Carboxypeptidase n=1 Tax=Ilex paraguariensis TaxID=185542 RepID=A0ABC8SKY7_9AQUA
MARFVLLCFFLLCLVGSIHCDDSGFDFKESLDSLGSPLLDSFAFDTSTGLPPYMGPQVGLKEQNKITTLPGQPDGINFDQYSGYVTIEADAERALFYYFVESPQNSSTKPLVLWLNGAPGCSAFGLGALMEVGPFRVGKDGKTLYQNEYAWTDVANVIFLETPAGAGFSYSNRTTNYKLSGDNVIVRDSYTFLVNWFERFSEYKTRDFFIVTEGYAGHYAPKLAQLILDNNKHTSQATINLRGIVMGNPYIDYETLIQGVVDYYWAHALISDEIYTALISNCNFSSPTAISKICMGLLEQSDIAAGNISSRNIYAAPCNSSSNPTIVPEFDPCSKSYVLSYLNVPEVQTALHANVKQWEFCKQLKDEALTVLPIIQGLMASGIPVWIYSGDVNAEDPVTSTRYAIKKLETSVKTPWYPWYVKEEVGGYVVEYQNLTFVTIRGAGHLAPSDQPVRSLVVFSSFLDGKLPPPYSSTSTGV